MEPPSKNGVKPAQCMKQLNLGKPCMVEIVQDFVYHRKLCIKKHIKTEPISR